MGFDKKLSNTIKIITIFLAAYIQTTAHGAGKKEVVKKLVEQIEVIYGNHKKNGKVIANHKKPRKLLVKSQGPTVLASDLVGSEKTELKKLPIKKLEDFSPSKKLSKKSPKAKMQKLNVVNKKPKTLAKTVNMKSVESKKMLSEKNKSEDKKMADSKIMKQEETVKTKESDKSKKASMVGIVQAASKNENKKKKSYLMWMRKNNRLKMERLSKWLRCTIRVWQLN